MTCFWNAIISSLKDEDKKILNVNGRIFPKRMVEILKSKNQETNNVTWNNEKLKERQIKENIEHIKELDINKINNGYLCSTCDPFLILLAETLKVKIKHNYNGTVIIYNNIEKERRTINLCSDRGHIWSC
jgi:hypothetical protein